MATALDMVQGFFPQVKQIVDSKRPLQVEVMASDGTKRGKNKHAQCAMANACKRTFRLEGAVISRTMAYLVNGIKATRYTLPTSVQKEILSFDRGAGFAPGTYSLRAVPKSQKLGTPRSDKPSKRAGKPYKQHRHQTTEIRASLHS